MKNATSFGKQASTYAKGRPGYPAKLYKWISANSPGQSLVWDVGTGSGQAAQALTDHFEHVHATDVSPEQISAAVPHPKISYHAAPAQSSGLSDNAADTITVATAVHWFAIYDIIDPYWVAGNRICMAGYTAEALNCPLPIFSTPDFDAGGIWTAQQLVNFAESWSAHFRAREAGLQAELQDLATRFLGKFEGQDIVFSLPLSVLAARIDS